jgi:hypothetical protein
VIVAMPAALVVIVSRRLTTARMVVSVRATALVTEVSMQRPRAAFVRQQRVDDFIDRVERRELVGELAVVFAVDHLDVDWFAVERQLHAVVGGAAPAQAEIRFLDLDLDSTRSITPHTGV